MNIFSYVSLITCQNYNFQSKILVNLWQKLFLELKRLSGRLFPMFILINISFPYGTLFSLFRKKETDDPTLNQNRFLCATFIYNIYSFVIYLFIYFCFCWTRDRRTSPNTPNIWNIFPLNFCRSPCRTHLTPWWPLLTPRTQLVLR